MSTAPAREGDVVQPVGCEKSIDASYAWGLTMMNNEAFEAALMGQLRGAIAVQHPTLVNGHGETLYVDVDTIVPQEVESREDRYTNNLIYTVSGTALYRLPRRADKVELAVDLRAYPLGSSFLLTDTVIAVLTDYTKPLMMCPESGRTIVASDIYFPMYSLWQPDEDMDMEEITRGGYDSSGVAELHKIRKEDEIVRPFFGGVL